MQRFNGKQITIKSDHGKYLSAQPNGKLEWNRDVAKEWEKFTVVCLDGGKVAFITCHGKYLSAQRDGTLEGNRDVPKAWEQFTVAPAGSKCTIKYSI